MSAELTGVQKAAIVLLNLEPDAAAEVMRRFSDDEAQQIAAEIIALQRVDSDAAERALEEFHTVTRRGVGPRRGGRAAATGLLEASFGTERAAGVMERVASSLAGRSFEFLDSVDHDQVAALLEGELAQTIALVLAHLRPEQSSAVLGVLPETTRIDVAQAIAGMSVPTPDAVTIVADTLKLRSGAIASPRESSDVVGGVQPLVDIINRADVAIEKSLLAHLEDRDPDLAEAIRARMLTFGDLARLGSRDAQLVLRGVDPTVLALAMKGSGEALIAVIRANLSERNREILDQEIEATGPVRVSQVEEARAEIVRVIRDLEAQGSITVLRGDEEEYVD